MTSSLSQRDLLLLPQTGTAGMLLTLFDQTHPPIMTSQALPVPSPTRVTSTHMPSALCEKLIQLCNQYHVIISDNGNSMDCRMKRRNLWIEISKQLNNEFNVEFTADQYKKKYQNLKTALKTKMQNMSQPGQQRQVSPDARRESQSSSTTVIPSQPTSSEIKQEMRIPTTSPGSPAPPQVLSTSLANLMTTFPSTSPVRPTPQVPMTPLTNLFDNKNTLLALAVQAAQQQVFQAGLASVSGISPHVSEVSGHHGEMDMQSLLSIASCQPSERPPSVDTSGTLGPLSVLRPISTGLLDRSMDHDTPAMGAEHPGSAVGSVSVSDHAAPLSSLPHISPQQDEDPARMFCLSLADPLRRIKENNPMMYVQLKKQISTIVLDAEMDTVKNEEEQENENNRMEG